MEDSIVTLGVYFEVKDAHLYGGNGSIGYCNTNVDLKNIDSILNSMSVENIAEEFGLKTKQVGSSAAVCSEDGNPIIMFSNETRYID